MKTQQSSNHEGRPRKFNPVFHQTRTTLLIVITELYLKLREHTQYKNASLVYVLRKTPSGRPQKRVNSHLLRRSSLAQPLNEPQIRPSPN